MKEVVFLMRNRQVTGTLAMSRWVTQDKEGLERWRGSQAASAQSLEQDLSPEITI